MPRTTTRYVDFGTLLTRGCSAVTVIKLMMAFNDLSLANEALSEWKKEQPKNKKPRQLGAMRYFVRMQLGHLYEGLKIIEEIRKNPRLSALVSRCGSHTQEAFQNLEHYLPGGRKRAHFERLVGRIRHNLAFHYVQSGKLIGQAITDRATRLEACQSSITLGDTAYLSHFKVADDVVDSIVVRQIWGIPRNADLRVEADKVADDVHRIFLSFVAFAGEFIWRYFWE